MLRWKGRQLTTASFVFRYGRSDAASERFTISASKGRPVRATASRPVTLKPLSLSRVPTRLPTLPRPSTTTRFRLIRSPALLVERRILSRAHVFRERRRPRSRPFRSSLAARLPRQRPHEVLLVVSDVLSARLHGVS